MTSMISLRGIPRLGVGFLVTLLCSLAGYALAKLPGFSLIGQLVLALLLGMATAYIVSLAAIRFLMDYVKKHTFTAFGWYRIALGIVVLAIWALQSYVMPI